MKDRIAKWYKQGLWSAGQVANAVKKNIITAEDYKEIVGEVYKAEARF